MKSNVIYEFKFGLCRIDMPILIIFLSSVIVSLLQFPTLLAQNTSNIYLLFNKGVTLDSLGNHTGAINYYDKALAINPNYINALDNKGVALDKLGNYTRSYKLL